MLIAVIGVVVMVSAITGGGNNDEPKSKVTIENFNKIETGMTYEQVCDIFGEEGTVASEVDIGDDQYKTTIYYWYDDTEVANCNVTIQGGAVVAKAQVGLK